MIALFQNYFDRLKLINPNLSEKTVKNHAQVIQNFMVSLDKPLSEIRYGEIEDFILDKSRRISAGWRNSILSVLDSWLSFLADRGEIEQSIADKFTVLKKKAYVFNVSQKVQKPPFDARDLKKLLQTVSVRRCNTDRRDQDLAVLGCMLFLGLRINEVLNIEIPEIEIRENYRKFYLDDDPEKGRDFARETRENVFSAVVSLPWGKIKGHSPDEPGVYRNVLWEVSEFAGINFYRLFKARYDAAVSQNKRFLFHNIRNAAADGEQVSSQYYFQNFPRWLKRAGIEQHYTTHQLRHTFASWNYGNPNIPAHIVQDLLGHKRTIDQFGGRMNGATGVYYNPEHPEDIDIYYKHAQEWIAGRD
jgi:integrase